MLKKSIIFGLKVTKGVTIMEIVPKVLATFQNTAYVSLTCKTVDFFLDPCLVNKLCSENPSFGFQHCVIRTDRLYVDNGSYVYAWSDKLQRIERVSTPSINDFRNYPSASNSGHW